MAIVREKYKIVRCHSDKAVVQMSKLVCPLASIHWSYK